MKTKQILLKVIDKVVSVVCILSLLDIAFHVPEHIVIDNFVIIPSHTKALKMMGVGGTQSQPASQQSPDYPMALSKIQVMSKDELDDLLNNDEKFDDYIRSLQQV